MFDKFRRTNTTTDSATFDAQCSAWLEDTRDQCRRRDTIHRQRFALDNGEDFYVYWCADHVPTVSVSAGNA